MILYHQSFFFLPQMPLWLSRGWWRSSANRTFSHDSISLDLHMIPRYEPPDKLPVWNVWTLDQKNRTVPRTNLKQLSVWVNKQNLFLAKTESCWIFFPWCCNSNSLLLPISHHSSFSSPRIADMWTVNIKERVGLQAILYFLKNRIKVF